jgi:MFS family permease
MTSARRRALLAGLLVPTAFTLAAEGVVNVSLMPYAAELHVPAAGLGVVFTAHRLVRIAASPFVGLLADRWGRRPLLLLGILCGACSLLVLSVASGFAGLLLARVLYGLASGLIVTVGLVAILDFSEPRRRGATVGLHQAAVYGVYPVGSALGGFVVDRLGAPSTFLGASIVLFGSLAVAAASVPETRELVGATERTAPPRLRDLPGLFTAPIRRYTALKMVSSFAIWGLFEATFVMFLLATLGEDGTLFGRSIRTQSLAGLLIAMLLAVGFLFGSPATGRWSDRTGRRMPLIRGSLGLTAVAVFGLAMASTSEAIASAVLALGLSIALVTAPSAALVGAAAPPHARAGVMAAYATCNDIASSAGAMLGVALALGVGYPATYLGGSLLVAGVGLAFTRGAEGESRPA